MRLSRPGFAPMALAALIALAPLAGLAQSPELRPDQAAFRAIYKELVETNTELSDGRGAAAAAMGTRLKGAGFSDADITYFSVPDNPKEGGRRRRAARE